MDGNSNGRHDIGMEDNPYTVGSRRRKKEALVNQVVEEQQEDGPPVVGEQSSFNCRRAYARLL